MYDYAWNKVRNYSGTGVGQDEAALYHRRAYGGFVRHKIHLDFSFSTSDIRLGGPPKYGPSRSRRRRGL